MYARINIGGIISYETSKKLIKAIRSEGLEVADNPVMLKTHAVLPDGTLEYEDYEAIDGEFKNLERFLKENSIHFVRYMDGIADYECEVVWFIPEKEHETKITLKSGSIAVPSYILHEIIKDLPNIVKNPPLYINNNEDFWVKPLAEIALKHQNLDKYDILSLYLKKIYPKRPPKIPKFNIEKNGKLLF